MSKKNIVPISDQPASQEESPNRLSFTLEEMLKEFENGAVPRSKFWRELITALYDTANHVVTGVTSVADVRPDKKGNIPIKANHLYSAYAEDVFGRSLFYGNSCKVVHQLDAYYEVLAGTAYVAGIRFFYPGMQELLIKEGELPTSVWVDVSWSSDYMVGLNVVVKIVVSPDELKDSADKFGFIHYFEKLSDIASADVLIDCRNTNSGSLSSLTHRTLNDAMKDENLSRNFIRTAERNGAQFRILENQSDPIPEGGFSDLSGKKWEVYNLNNISNANNYGALGNGKNNDTNKIKESFKKGDNTSFFTKGSYIDDNNKVPSIGWPSNSVGNISLWKGSFDNPDLNSDNFAPTFASYKITKLNRNVAPKSFDGGAGYFFTSKEGGDSYVSSLTSHIESNKGSGDTIAIHARARGHTNNSRLWGNWSFVVNENKESPNDYVTTMIGHEINIVNNGSRGLKDQIEERGKYIGQLITVAGNDSKGCSVGLEIGRSDTSYEGWITGIKIRSNGIIPSSEIESECIFIEGSYSVYHRYGGILFGRNLSYGIDSVSSVFYNDVMMHLGVNQKIAFSNTKDERSFVNYIMRDGNSLKFKNLTLMINDNVVVKEQQPAILDSNGSSSDNQRATNEILNRLRNHGLIAR